MPSAAPQRDDHAAAIGRLAAALLAGESDVAGVDPRTDARVRAVIGRLVAARADLASTEVEESER